MPPTPRPRAAAGFRRLVKFGLAGVAGFAVDFSVLVGLHSGARWPLVAATLVAYAAGGTVNYSLSRWWVFPHVARGDEAGKVGRYVALSVANAAATTLALAALTATGVDYRVAKALTVVVLFFVNFALTPWFVMRSTPSSITRPS